ncbi:hypothetical protein [Paenibacillus sp. 1A_MP2]
MARDRCDRRAGDVLVAAAERSGRAVAGWPEIDAIGVPVTSW